MKGREQNEKRGELFFFEKDEKGWIILRGEPGQQRVDLKMLQHNKIQGFLDLQIRHIDEQCLYHYDTSGMCSLVDCLEGKQADYGVIKGIYRDIVSIYRNCQEYFLQEENCIFEPEYIFWNGRKGEWKICYFPGYGISLEKQIGKLNEYLLQKINHKDKQCVKFLYGIYELIQQEGVYLEILEDYIQEFMIQEEGREKKIDIKMEEKREISKKRKRGKTEKLPVFYLKKVSSYYGIPDMVEITSNDFRVGRLEDNDLVLPAEQISRRHAKISVDKNRLYLYDCQSTNGVWLNGKKIAGNQEVSCQEEDIITFGNISYKIQK